MNDVTAMVLVLVPVVAILGLAAWAALRSNPRKQKERLHYRQTYGLSMDRMLAESPVDREEVRRLRDSGRRGAELQAASDVRRWDPVPLEVALDFVRRL